MQKVPSGIKIGKEQLKILAYADDIVLIGKNEIEIRQLFVEMESIARKLGVQINQEKTNYMTVERKNILNQNNTGPLKIKNYTFAHLKELKTLNTISLSSELNGRG